MQNYRDLLVWKKAHHLVLDDYKATKLFPKEEIYGITSQIRRASVSIPANIAEGCGKYTHADIAHFSKFLWVHCMKQNIVFSSSKTWVI